MTRLFIAVLGTAAAACLLGGRAARLEAQTLCSEDPTQCGEPAVTITPASFAWSGTEAVSELEVTIEWCDAFGLDAGSREVRLDGVAVASTWTVAARTAGCFARAVSQVTLAVGAGAHTLTAEVRNTDGVTGAASGAYTYTYTPPPPTTAPTLTRGDPAWPARVTSVRHPNGRAVFATYDARGNLSTVTDTSTKATHGRAAVTSYAWDPRWDAVTRVTGPEGETSAFGYDDLGRRAWEQAGDDPARRVFYRYYGMESATAPGLPRAVQTPLRTDSLLYDGRGNLRSAQKTTVYADALGRDTLSVVDGVTTRFRHDALGRVVRQTVLGRDSIVVVSQYDREGRVLRTGRRMHPDPNRIGTLWQSWRYDGAGRVVIAAKDSSGVFADSTYHPPSGAYTDVFTTRGSGPLRNSVRTETDALGRVVRRASTSSAYREESFAVPGREFRFPRFALGPAGAIAIPGDTATFTYDASGNLLTADNRDARITRAYHPNGLLATETQSLRSATGSTFGAHVFTLSYRYDLAGRLVRVRYPSQLAFAAGKDSAVYQYAPGTGELARVLDLEGNAFVFGYDASGQVTRLDKPGGIWEGYGYYDDGTLESIGRTAENVFAGTAGGLDYLRGEWIDRTWGGKVAGVQAMKRASRTSGSTMQAGSVASTYDAFGALETFRYDSPPHLLKEAREVESDPLGNPLRQVLTRRVVDELSGGDDVPNASRTTTDTMVYQPGRGQLAWRGTLHPDGLTMNGRPLYIAEHRWHFDAAGNLGAEDRWRYLGKDEVGDHGYFYDFNLRELARSYYDAEDRLRFYDRQRCVVRSYSSGGATSCDPWTNWPHHESGVWQEYRYDALGRRVMVSAAFESACENGCRSYTDWVVWSGDQMLGELRGGFGSDTYGAGSWEGRIAYTHGPGIDAPLSFVRHGLNAAAVTIVPHANWRGTYGAGTYKNGSTAGILDLTTVRWPADDLGAYLAPTEPYAEDQPWIGVLIGNIRDANGWLYRRNRYYDPATGRFTQEDPIGIAGGLNLYAFGSGDAVSYADPYGLKVCFWGSSSQIAALKRGTESATGTTFDLDRENCVDETSVQDDGRDELKRNRSIFGAMVSSTSRTFVVRYASPQDRLRVSSFGPARHVPNTWHAVIVPSDIGDPYDTPVFPRLGCVLNWNAGTAWDLGALIAHELIGHGSTAALHGHRNGWPDGIPAENRYHRAYGQPVRCGQG